MGTKFSNINIPKHKKLIFNVGCLNSVLCISDGY